MPKALLSLTLALGSVLASTGAGRADDVVLVLDASGSMWGQIEGKTKAEIARASVGGLLDRVPPERRLGLVAYGHRREGDCADIEELVPLSIDRAPVRRAVSGLQFKGKTPLGAAVRFAAERLRYTEAKATVILVSDGVETCGVDPCALGRELEAKGIDFVAHVIGFGLATAAESAGLRCLAEATGGHYFEARNARDLGQALTETVAAPPERPPQTARVVLRATELDGGPEIASGLRWTVSRGDVVFVHSEAGVVATELPPGDYRVAVASASGLRGSADLAARAGVERTVTIPLEVTLSATLTLTPASGASAGSTVSVAWKGPNRPGDYVTVVRRGALPAEYLDYRVTSSGNPVAITLPVEAGEYEMRYVLAQPTRVLASVPVTTAAADATVVVPSKAPAGTEIDVTWNGPGAAGDWVTVVRPEAPVSAYNSYFDTAPGNRKLTLPTEPGTYEVRYVQGGQKVLARAPIEVTAVAAQISAPARVAAGAEFEISWTGPNLSGDWLTIIEPHRQVSEYRSYVDAPNGSPARLVAPDEPGAYELRYVLGGTSIIGRRPIVVGSP